MTYPAQKKALGDEEVGLVKRRYASDIEIPAMHLLTDYTLNQEVLRQYRKARFENQTEFWARFGVTQSRGSRFEMGTEIPPPVAILLNLYIKGVINDGHLGGIVSQVRNAGRLSISA